MGQQKKKKKPLSKLEIAKTVLEMFAYITTIAAMISEIVKG